jgi:hypothetical protein
MRGVALMLLSWLLPMMAPIAVGFLVALPFTGLDPLWATRNATAVLLAAVAALVVLINAAHQDGETPPPRPVRLAARAVALALTPLVAIADWGLWLRIGQHGLTPDRVIAAACVLVAVCYAAGYGAAVVLPSRWQGSLEGTNVLATFVALGTILALLTPLADPARLSVANQLRRLERGEVSVERFDFAFLRFGSGRYGLAALERLRNGEAGPGTAEVAARAEETLRRRTRPERGVRQVARDLTPEERAARITVHPAGQSLPESFLRHGLAGGGSDGGLPCLRGTGHCDAFLIDMDGDGAPEIVPAGIGWIAVLRNTAEDRWVFAGNLPLGRCAGVVEALRQGRFALVAPTWRDLEVDGRRLRLRAEEAC